MPSCREIERDWGGPVGIEARAPSRLTTKVSVSDGHGTFA